MTVVRPSARHRVALCAVCLALLPLAGCSSGSSPSEEKTPTGPVRQDLSKAGSKNKVDAKEFARTIDTAVKGKRTAKITLTGSGGVKGTGSVLYEADSISLSLDLTSDKQELKIRLLPEALYVTLPTLENGKPWLKIEKGADAPLAQRYASLFASVLSSADLSTVGDRLGDFLIVTSGTEKIGKVEATRYVMELDRDQILASIPARLRDVAKTPLTKQLKDAVQHIELYVGPDGLPQRNVAVTMVKDGTASTVIDWSAWGQKVSIAPPPAQQITPLKDIAS
ncbi:MAG: hypothetical protein QG608_1251 [Actinomycetota bacterium]|nr:hypothetical protein [Actinomycetota bacterium]